MAAGAIVAELPEMRVLRMAADAFDGKPAPGGRHFSSGRASRGMTCRALDLRMRAVQRETRRRDVIESRRRPRDARVTRAARLAEAALVRIIRLMAADASSR